MDVADREAIATRVSGFEMKELHKRKARLEARLKRVRVEYKEAKQAFESTQRQLARVDQVIASARAAEPEVNDHAIVRYLERSGQIDVGRIKDEILNETTREQIRTVKSGKFPLANGLKAIAHNGFVVTVIDERTHE